MSGCRQRKGWSKGLNIKIKLHMKRSRYKDMNKSDRWFPVIREWWDLGRDFIRKLLVEGRSLQCKNYSIFQLLISTLSYNKYYLMFILHQLHILPAMVTFFGSVPGSTQWNSIRPNNWTPMMAYRVMKNRKKMVTFWICWEERLKNGFSEFFNQNHFPKKNSGFSKFRLTS